MVSSFTLLLVCVQILLARAVREFDALRPDYSAKLGNFTDGCDSKIIPLTMTYNSCFQIPLLLQTFLEPEFMDNANAFLTAICAPNAPMCPEDRVKASAPALEEACLPDYKTNPGSVQGLTTVIMGNYPVVKDMLCSKNMRGEFCAMEVLSTVQSKLWKNIDYPMVRDAINGNSTYMPQLAQLLESGAMCTGCVSRYLYLGRQIKTTVPLPDALPSVQARCGSWFGTQEVPYGVEDPTKHEATKLSVPLMPPAETSRVNSASGRLPSGQFRFLFPLVLMGLVVR